MQTNNVSGYVQMIVRLFIVALTLSACEDKNRPLTRTDQVVNTRMAPEKGINHRPAACQEPVDLRSEVQREVLDYFTQVAFATGECPSMRPLDDLSVMCGWGSQFENDQGFWYTRYTLNRSGPRYLGGGDPFIDGDEFVRACRWGKELRRSVERQDGRFSVTQRVGRGFDALMYADWRTDARRAAQLEGNTRAIEEREACMRIALMEGPGPYWRSSSGVVNCLELPQYYVDGSRQRQLEKMALMIGLWTRTVTPTVPWLYTAANSASIMGRPSWVWRSPR